MDIYLAAPYAARDLIKGYAEQLDAAGIHVTSSWLDEEHEINDGTIGAATGLDDKDVAAHASDDFADIKNADTLLLFTGQTVCNATGAVTFSQTTSGGRHVETGYFMARRGSEHVIVVGAPENVFHRAEGVVCVTGWHQALLEIMRRLASREGNPNTQVPAA